MSINGDYMSMAEAAGEVAPQSHGWTAEEIDEQFDGDHELMHVVFERERYDAMSRLSRENDALRAHLAAYEGGEE